MCLANILEIVYNVLLREQVNLTVYLIRLSRQKFDKKRVRFRREREEDIFILHCD